MTPTEGIKRVETDLKSIRAAIRAVKKDVAGRKGAESGDNAAAAEKLDALLGMVDGLGSTIRQVTGEIKETKARVAVETERDKALKTVEKMAETAEAAGSESDGQKTQITYLKRQVDALTALSDGYGFDRDPGKGERFLHNFTQTLTPHLCRASHDAANSSGGTYFSAECSLA